MLRPHLSLESLLNALLPELAEQQGRGGAGVVPKPIPIIVPSKQLADWLQTQMARRTGLCMGYEFLPPNTFIEKILKLETEEAGLSFASNLWAPENLAWRLLPYMGEYATRLGLRGGSQDSRDLFALACLVADQLDQYTHFRPALFREWKQGKVATSRKAARQPHLVEAEAWQRELWTLLDREISALPEKQSHPALLFSRLEETGRADAGARETPCLFVIGIGTLDPLLVQLLRLLANSGTEISTHVVLPSLHYLDDLRRDEDLYSKLGNDPELDPPADGNPLLISLGRQAIGAFQLIGQIDENFSGWDEPEEAAPEQEGLSLLKRIQGDIRGLRRPVLDKQNTPTPADDLSLRVHACHGPRREVEVLRDELFRAFQDLPDLKPEEVVVVCSDLAPYAPLVEAILRRGVPALPLRLTELPDSEKNPLTEALVALLDFARGRWPASGLIELCHLRAIRSHLGLGDDDKALIQIKGWIRDSGLTEEGPQASKTEAVSSQRAWRASRDRLIAGAWFGQDASLTYPDDAPVLPVTGSLDGMKSEKSAFIAWHLQLEQLLRSWGRPATAAVWGERLAEAYDKLLAGPDDAKDFGELNQLLRKLKTQDCPTEVDTGTLLDWVSSQFEEHSAARSSLTGDISVGRFKQLQNQPCRVLAMLGMQDGLFPRQARTPAWDLLQLDPKRWDRNPRVEDKQLFLDAVLTPKERLIITASVQNLRTGKREPFSACVDELLRAAPTQVPMVNHRLYPFSPAYYTRGGKDGLPPSFDTSSLEIAKALAERNGGAGIPQPLWEGPIAPATPAPTEFSLEDLIRFWRDPARAFLSAQGLTLPRDEEDERDLDRLPLNLDKLQEWQVKNRLLDSALRLSAPLPQALVSADRGLPPGALGDRQWTKLAPVAETIADGLHRLQLQKPKTITIHIKDYSLECSLHQGVHKGEPCLLAYRPGRFDKTRDLQGVWIEALAAALAGIPMPTLLVGEELHDSGLIRCLPAIPREQATRQLELLVDGFILGRERPLGYAPATSEDYLKRLKDSPDADPQKLREAADANWFKDGGDGQGAGALLAWRDRDPFSDTPVAGLSYAADWHTWMDAIARPLKMWRDAMQDLSL